MVTLKILIAMLSVCASLFVAALVHTQTTQTVVPTPMPASKLAVRNAPRVQADPYRSMTATPNAKNADPVTKLIQVNLPDNTLIPSPTPAPTKAPAAVPSPTPRPTASFDFDLTYDAVRQRKPIEAMKLMIGRQFAEYPLRVTTRTRATNGETHEHVLKIVSPDRWSEVNTLSDGAVEIVQIGPIRYRREGGAWQVSKATHDVLPSADKMARDAADSFELLAANVQLEGNYNLNGRDTLLYYYAYQQQSESSSRVWFDSRKLRPLLNETTLADGTMIMITYDYGPDIVIEVPIGGGW